MRTMRLARKVTAAPDCPNACLIGASGSSFDDEDLGYGALWNLDRQIRLRLWYTHPNKVAHAANVAEPKKVDMLTTEIQVRY